MFRPSLELSQQDRSDEGSTEMVLMRDLNIHFDGETLNYSF